MRTNPVKRILRSGKPSFGTWLSLGDLYATRVLARMGFDWLTLDLEHSAIDWSQAAMIFAAVADAGCVPLARVPKGNHDYIKRVLDAGAWGIVVPMVDTVEQAKIAIAAAKYPPVGNRSLGGGMHALNFDASPASTTSRPTTRSWSSCRPKVPRASPTPRRFIALPGVDAIFVGPVDLRANMRSPDGKRGHRRRIRGHACSASLRSARRPARRPACTRWTRGGFGPRGAGNAVHRHRQRPADDDPKGTRNASRRAA